MPSRLAAATSTARCLGVVGVGERDVVRSVVEGVEERVGSARRAVDELVDDHEVAGMDRRLQRPGRERCQQQPDAEIAHHGDVGAVVHAVRRQMVVAAVAGKERDPVGPDGADGDPVATGRRTRVATTTLFESSTNE